MPSETHAELTPAEVGDRVFGVETGGQDYGTVTWFNTGTTQWPWSSFFREPKPSWYTDPGESKLHVVHGIVQGAAVLATPPRQREAE